MALRCLAAAMAISAGWLRLLLPSLLVAIGRGNDLILINKALEKLK
ncbi:MAG: hypothetical protein M2R45_05445 [Verrucomicrobia subdivision 3 bacterium]|nr:hypothetical protein [Limisphaerales bacterium]MCS1417789.1 hypothetical protein [Limisphaerales bacterium]